MTILFNSAIYTHLDNVGVYYCRDVRQCDKCVVNRMNPITQDD